MAFDYNPDYDPFGPNYPRHPYYKKINNRRLARNEKSRSRFANDVPPTAPQNTTRPVIFGTPEYPDGTLLMSSGTWLGPEPITYVYRWYADGALIVGATSQTYQPIEDDIGKKISGEVDATNAHGTTTTTTSNGMTVVYTDQTFPATIIMVPAAISLNAGYSEPAVAGSLSNPHVEGEHIARLQSFGENWCMLDLAPVGDENGWNNAPEMNITFSGAFTGSGKVTLAAASGYSYGGNITGIQAGLNAAIGQNVTVVLSPAGGQIGSIVSGPYSSSNGADFYFRHLQGDTVDWDVGFDIDGSPPADIWENLREWLDNSAASQDYKNDVEAQAISEGWTG